MDRQEMIVPDLVSPGSEIARWMESFRRVGYCVLDQRGWRLRRWFKRDEIPVGNDKSRRLPVPWTPAEE